MSFYISDEYIYSLGKLFIGHFPCSQVNGNILHINSQNMEKFARYLSELFLILEITTAFYNINSLVSFPSRFENL